MYGYGLDLPKVCLQLDLEFLCLGLARGRKTSAQDALDLYGYPSNN